MKKGARSRYSTIQNWSTNVYNLVTQRAKVFENASHEWVDANIGSKVTMKYPSCYLMEPGARGEMLSMAFAGPGQTQDAGGKMYHFAPNTTSKITSKSISKAGGRASYRGMVKVYKGAKGVKSNVVCDALLLDPQSRSDTYPNIEIDEDDVTIGHEASVSKVGEEQLFYLMSRGLSEEEATSMVVSGFIEPLIKELPMEYAVEMNRLIAFKWKDRLANMQEKPKVVVSRTRRAESAAKDFNFAESDIRAGGEPSLLTVRRLDCLSKDFLFPLQPRKPGVAQTFITLPVG